MSLSSYPKIYNLGHKALLDLFDGSVSVEEKVDGSQFSFGVRRGELCCRSKGKQIVLDAPDSLFVEAVAVVKQIASKVELPEGFTFRCEYLKKPKHNGLKYDRIPTNHLCLFDVDSAEECYVLESERNAWAETLGIDYVPTLFYGVVTSRDWFDELLERESYLGGCKIEGLVFKNYNRFNRDGKTVFGKYVSPEFREIQRVSWKANNKGGTEIREEIAQNLRSERRWEKAVEWLRDNGQLDDSPKDIGPLIKRVQTDLHEECVDYIKDKLYDWGKKHIYQRAIAGLPEWYKQRLLENQFATIPQHLSTSIEKSIHEDK